MAEVAFSKFMVLCRKVTGQDEEVLKLIKKRHQKAKSDFIQSDDFVKLLERTTDLITNDVINKYVHIKDLLTELKAYQEQPAKPSRSSNVVAEIHTDSSARKRIFDSDTDSIPDMKRHHGNVSKDLDENSKDSNVSESTSEAHKPDKTSHKGNSDARRIHLVEHTNVANGESVTEKRKRDDVSSAECESSKRCKESEAGDCGIKETTVGNGGDGLGYGRSTVPSVGRSAEGGFDTGDTGQTREGTDGQAAKRKGSERQIIKLEGLLKDISKRIRKLEEKEMSLDEMEDDSAYTLVERYKAKFVKVWNKLCSLKGRAPTTGRPIERKFHFEGTRYPEVNKRIERFVNRHQIFPDFHDILEIVTRSNVKHCLRLGKKSIQVITREAFLDVGNQLQARRMRDFQGNFGSHLTESYRERNDPALYDKELHTKLDCNKVLWKSSLDEVINKFAKRQELGDDLSEDEEEEEEEKEAGGDGELLYEGADEEEVGKRETSVCKDGDDSREEKVGEDDDEKKDEDDDEKKDEDDDEKKDEDDDEKKDEDDDEKKGEEESGRKKLVSEEKEKLVEGNEEEKELGEKDAKSRDAGDSSSKDAGKNGCSGSNMPDVLEESISPLASEAAIDTEVKNVDKTVVKETSSSHISTVSSTGSCNDDDQPTPDDNDGNNQTCDANTNTREWHNTDDDSNSFNSCDMNIVERDYSNDSKKNDDSNDSKRHDDVQCYNLSSSSSSSSPSSSEVDSLSSDEGSNSRHEKKSHSPDLSYMKKAVTDFTGALAEAIDNEKSKDVESSDEHDDNGSDVDRPDSQSDVLIMDGTAAFPNSQCMFSPSKLIIKSQPFQISCPGMRSDSPIIITDQDDKATLPKETSLHDIDDKTTLRPSASDDTSSAVMATFGDTEMNIKIKNYCSLSSNIVVKVTTPDSTTLTESWPELEPQIGKNNSAAPCQQYPWKSVASPVVTDEVIELSDSE